MRSAGLRLQGRLSAARRPRRKPAGDWRQANRPGSDEPGRCFACCGGSGSGLRTPSAGVLDGGLSGGQQITATAKYTILRCSGPVKSTNDGFRPALTALPSTSRAERKITAEFFPLRAECINTGIACEFLRPLNLLIVLFGIESAVPVPKGVDISSAIISLYRKHTHSYISVSNCP